MNMAPIQRPITGHETNAATDGLPGALSEFYRAFNTRDMALMQGHWQQSDEVVMDNPVGGIARGWHELQPLYEKLFRGPMDVHVEFHDYTLHEAYDFAYALGRERGTFLLDGERMPVAIRTSRLFRRIGRRWRQVHHHGSIDDAELLARYKRAAAARP